MYPLYKLNRPRILYVCYITGADGKENIVVHLNKLLLKYLGNQYLKSFRKCLTIRSRWRRYIFFSQCTQR